MPQNIKYPSGGKHLLGLPTSGENRPASIMTTTFRALERFVSDIRDGKNAPTPRGTASPKRRFRLRPNSCGEVDPALVIDVGVVECSQDEGKVEVSHDIIGGDTPTTEIVTTMDDTRRFQVVQEGHRGDEMDNPNLQKREGEQQEEEQPEEQQGMYPLATDDDELENNQQHEVGYREAYGKLNATSEGCTAGNCRADIGDGMGYADSSQRLNAISPEQLCCKSVGEGTNVKTSIGVQPLSHHERHRLENNTTNGSNYSPSEPSNGCSQAPSQIQSRPKPRSYSQPHHTSTLYGLNPDSLGVLVPPCLPAIRRPKKPVELNLLSPPEDTGAFSTHSPRNCSTPASTLSTPTFSTYTTRTATPEMPPPRSSRGLESINGRAWSHGSRQTDSILGLHSGSGNSHITDESIVRRNVLPRCNETPELMLEFPRATERRRYT